MTIRTTHDCTNKRQSTYKIPTLPLKFDPKSKIDLESKAILKKAAEAHSALAELKGVAVSIPNETILINTLALQEAKDSSEIENIITTQDELYQSDMIERHFASVSAKEVYMYVEALLSGYHQVKQSGLLASNHIKSIQAELEGNNAGFRSQSGTALKNTKTGEFVYAPPQELQQIEMHMKNLEAFINQEDASGLDELVKMAIIHHQFESIHPFFDGNGRTGRIINILYLVKQGLLDTPILYLSRYINQNKPEYYALLQAVREQDSKWEKWVLFMLEGVRQTSYQTIQVVKAIKELMLKHKHKIRDERKKIYSQDLVNVIFSHPYTKINHIEKSLQVSRPTATKYLNALEEIGIMHKVKLGRDSYYVNRDLMVCLSNVPDI